MATKYKIIIYQCIQIEYKSKNSWYHSVFTLNTIIFDSVYMYKHKLMVSQCIHIEYKSKISWYHSVLTLNTKVKTHGITMYSHKYKLMKDKLIVSLLRIVKAHKNKEYPNLEGPPPGALPSRAFLVADIGNSRC
ncbi:hypothetical protein OUZ56_026256 [Daphnia magna]|uniref:Uncharacterized protein n=1 Tax=Daphnia magna TaxID=35525 RepID=A0ABQ9ZML0_9CRUS|nr:hypothetical protein OUZ56_026256 [Daphnia magna]